MGLFDIFLGRKSVPSTPSSPSSPRAAATAACGSASLETPSSPNLAAENADRIRVFDSYGREIFITRQAWRESVLLGNLQKAWDQPNDLCDTIESALKDGFRADVVAAAQHLYEIDPERTRAACIWGIVLLQEERLAEAEKVFLDAIAHHGENGVILTHLARVYVQRHNVAKAQEVLRHALELDPNQETGLAWYRAMHRENGGEPAAFAAMQRAAALPGSWRPQLWLARRALEARDLPAALELYQQSLASAGQPYPTDLLTQMSGDLGNAGHLVEVLQWIEPHFDAARHGLDVGNNLIKANLDLGQVGDAHRLLDALYALNRPAWKDALRFWDTEIARVAVTAHPSQQRTAIQMAILTIAGPVWLKPKSPAAQLFPAKSPESLVICFLGSSAELRPPGCSAHGTGHGNGSSGGGNLGSTTSGHVVLNPARGHHGPPAHSHGHGQGHGHHHPQGSPPHVPALHVAGAPGRLSRAVPLFLAEQIEMGSYARTRTLVPWMAEPIGGFALSGVPWRDENALQYAQQSELQSDYVAISHLQAPPHHGASWTLEVRLVRSADGQRVGRLTATFSPADPEAALHGLASELRALLVRDAELDLQPFPEVYTPPTGKQFPGYLLSLEQLLAVRSSAMEGVELNLLHGERDTIADSIQQCLATPRSVCTRLVLARTLLAIKRTRPQIPAEFRHHVHLLQTEHPLPQPSHGIVQGLFDEALS